MVLRLLLRSGISMRTSAGKSLKAPGSAAAFSLVEATVGLALLAVVCLALYSGLSSTTFSVRLSRENLRATQIMAEKLDTIRLYGWNQLTNATYVPRTFTSPFYPHDQLPP